MHIQVIYQPQTHRDNPTPPPHASPTATDATVRDYASRGRDCAYGNLRLMTRVIGSLYDEALRDVGLHAAQLQLLWAIVAVEPVELGELASVTHTRPDDAFAHRREAPQGATRRRPGRPADARRKEVRMTALGRERFAAAMPRWEAAQQKAAALLRSPTSARSPAQVRRGARSAS